LLDEHVRHCVMDAAAKGDDSKVTEATAAIERLIRS
jgi:DNA-binding FrmR family transcriptional regulator